MRAPGVYAIATLAVLAGCRPGPDPTPAEPAAVELEPASAVPSPTCAGHRAALREELCGDEDDCDAAELACALDLDLDGDRKPDHVELARDGEALVVRVRFATGATELVGATPTPLASAVDEAPEPGRTLGPDLAWLVAWDVARREGETLVHGRMRFEAGPALGDGLWLSGTDAAAMLVWTSQGPLIVELGY